MSNVTRVKMHAMSNLSNVGRKKGSLLGNVQKTLEEILIRYLIACLLLLTFCLPAHAAPDTPERPPILQGVHRIVCLGDSITQGGEGPGGCLAPSALSERSLWPQDRGDHLHPELSRNCTEYRDALPTIELATFLCHSTHESK